MYRYLIAALLATALVVPAYAQLAPQVHSQNGVKVVVSPRDLAANAEIWTFGIVLDTHSQDLSDDLVQSTVLVDDMGREVKPVAWEGAQPGGHHREGVLKFKPLAPLPSSVELRMTRPGESTARVFQWRLD